MSVAERRPFARCRSLAAPAARLGMALILLAALGCAAGPRRAASTSVPPQNVDAAVNAYTRGDCRESIRLFSATLHGQEHPALLNGLGMAQLQCRQARNAVDSLQRAVSLSPDSAALHTNLATAFFALGEYRKAEREFDAALRLDSANPEALVGKAGIFATRIVDVKRSRGKTFVIAAGLLNHFLRPAIAGLLAALPLERAYDGPCEPLWSGRGTVAPKAFGRPAPARTVTVCGNLCTAMDTVARDIVLENAVVGNVLVFENAGAYAAALSPHDFSGRPGVKEILWG